MAKFYAPVAALLPEEIDEPVWVNGYGVIPRKWDVSIFDLAELQSKHNMHLSYTSANDRLRLCNLELGVEADSLDDAQARIRLLHAMMYVHDIHPFSVQFISTHSVNEYAGVNSRSRGEYGKELLHEGLREGITSGATSVEIWPPLYSSGAAFRCTGLQNRMHVNLFSEAVDDAVKWAELRERFPVCRFLERVLTLSPMVPDKAQSLLQVWTGIESLFPRVQSEVSFRIALYLAQLQAPLGDRQEFFQKAKRSYNDRSKVAHGGELKQKGDADPWGETWGILVQSIRAVLARRNFPSEEDLIRELLAAADAESHRT